MARKKKRHLTEEQHYYLKCASSLKGFCEMYGCTNCIFDDEEKGCLLKHAPESWDFSSLHDN